MSKILKSAFLLLLSLGAIESVNAQKKQEQTPPLQLSQIGNLIYSADSLGNRVPDFSYCGYKLSTQEIPLIETKIRVPLVDGDATSLLQSAIDYVASLPVDENGFRGAIQLHPGTYRVKGRFRIETSGIVIRGAGFGEDGTKIEVGGSERETFFRVKGGAPVIADEKVQITTNYVPVNSTTFTVENTDHLKVDQKIFLTRPATEEWIELLGMKEFGGESGWLGWRAGYHNSTWDRTITNIEGNKVTIDVPITTALDQKYGGAYLHTASWENRIHNIGIENLSLVSTYNAENPKDEEHCWNAISFENAANCWVRQVTFQHFAGSAVAVYESAAKVTVEDCLNLEPVSEIAAYRRNAFYVGGQETLVLRCYAEYGWHDFSTGFFAAGPNAFVQCQSYLPNNFSGAADSWASGVLFDIVNVDGQKLCFTNRGQDAQGAGWTAANSMFWQCSAAKIENFAPPGAQNWAYGAWAQFAGNGYWNEANSHVKPRSLFYKQLQERLNNPTLGEGQVITYTIEDAGNPTPEEATRIAEYLEANHPLSVREFILKAPERNPIQTNLAIGKIATVEKQKDNKKVEDKTLVSIKNGWIVANGVVITGQRATAPWWNLKMRPREIGRAKIAVTRYVPGREGKGFTDRLKEVIDDMDEHNQAVYEQNYALWYERRRDDHERIRRMDGDVWAPFYELPFERSGQGLAWDGLSKYDLTKYNLWYWNRLKEFADLAEQNSKVLIHQNYFQHNILEAGAHWVDSPWRTVNNINNTGFPEPPLFAGDKRIFIADEFYDITNPVRRELHVKYIRQCLNNFKDNSCVIQTTSEEFTGPLHFVEFWLDVVSEWEQETGKHPLIALSTTKDVQDAILADPVRSKIVDIIDIRYWSSRADGSEYAPVGGANLAPRQFARLEKKGPQSVQQVYNDVLTYKKDFPEKAVMYSFDQSAKLAWPIFMAGGSLAGIPKVTVDGFLAAAAQMKPVATAVDGVYQLENEVGERIFFLDNSNPGYSFSTAKGTYQLIQIDPATGDQVGKIIETRNNAQIDLEANGAKPSIFWLKKK